ncbi:MAG: NDP-hexose 2,3-dehydratase family protein [bacterium]|nr:NDP-hexose 2,3-dehydratase family protein [bacterium]
MKDKASRIRKEVDGLCKNLQKVLHFSGESKNIDFYISSLTEYNPFYTTEGIEEWLKSLNNEQYFHVDEIPLAKLRKWNFDKRTGDLEHASGGFFSIRGLKVKTNMGEVPEWSQPIIYQPEIGVLGIITKNINGILYFLMQAKAEPGNINTYQLSPTIQATRSNYMRLHGGKPTTYLEYCIGRKSAEVLIDQLQSEQGARFLNKRNRNIIVRLRDDQEIKLGSNYRWLTLGQIKALAQKDNLVNMDARSVISTVDFAPETTSSLGMVSPSVLRNCLENSSLVTKPVSDFAISLMVSSHPNSKALHTMEKLFQKISQEKAKVIFERQLIPLKEVENWIRTPREIFHKDRKYFSVISVRVKAENREVSSWDQPIIKQQHAGIVGFIVKEINGVLHFLVQLKMESGVMDLLEIAPTVQCITDNYSQDDMPRYTERFLVRRGLTTVVDSYQSEEGGRFYQESNHSIVLLADKKFPEEEPPFFTWVNLAQLKGFIKFNNFVNVETRSLLACLPTR